MALFELTELASYLQHDIDTATATLARDLATGLVLDATGVLEQQTSVMVLPIDRQRREIVVPSNVVTAVASVAISGVTLTADVDYVWKRPLPRIILWYPVVASWTFMVWPTATVTATVGYASGKVPAVAKAVALSVAARAYDNPTGARSESIDDYSVTRAGSDADLAGLTLTAAEAAALERLRTTAYVTR